MRIYCLLLITSLLNSCAYYGDIHDHSHQMDTKSLNKPHVYSSKVVQADLKPGWWDQFKNPELNQLVSVAIADAPQMQIAQNRVQTAQQLAEQSRAALFPSIDLSGYLQRQKFSQYGLAPPPFNGQTFNIGDLGLNFNYEFDFWGKNRDMLKAKIGEALASAADLQEAQLVISSTVARVYFQLQNDIAQTRISHDTLKLDKQELHIATDRLTHGIRSSIPMKTIQVDMESAKQNVEKFQQAALLDQHQLAILLGENPFNTVIKAKRLTYHAYTVSLPKSLPANLLANRPDIHAAQLRAEAAANKVKVAKALFFPDINLNLLFSYQSVFLDQLFNSASQNNAVTGAIDLPIFDAGERRANLRVKYSEYDTAVNAYNATILNALHEVDDQVTILKTIRSQLKAQNIALRAAKQNEQLHLILYHRGIIDYVGLLDFKLDVLKQRQNQLNLQTYYLQTVAALLTALGGKDA